MNSIARNALRLSLAGAGVAVLGAGVVGQASAAESTDLSDAPGTPDLTELTDAVQAGNDVTMDFGTPVTASADSTSTDSAPTSDVLFDDLPALEIPGMMYVEVPTVS